MPLSRYQVRNEYSLADPELYKSADKDDPEALLEGVAMAGLVGVLRQLGDLAEFAAEVFHNLHEEVMATAARGHSLTARVQQLEVEFPLIEKAFLSQTNHSAFFYNAGIDWHPNMHIDQNYITRGDLPRFVRDSHEEARGPPRLFLLDKFDVAGAGACLKRFTDPSFYKVEVITNGDIQRDKKVRKGKRRGSRWKNGETPEVLTTPHAKLHQLLLEERIENSASDPTRRVKLKRRLNGFPFVLKTGKSYMEKVLLTPPPDYRELHEVYNYSSSPLKILGSNFMPELEKDDFGSESPDVEFAQRSPSMSPDLKDGSQNVSMSEMEFESSNGSYHFKPEFGPGEIGTESPDLQLTHRSPYLTPEKPDSVPNISTDQEFESLGIENKDFPEVMNSLEVDNIPTPLYEDPIEKQIIVDKESKSEGSAGYKSVDFASDAENYMDALATMESEMETDSELREKGNLHVLSNRKRITSPDASTPLRETHFSDSQSIGSSTLSDDGNSSSKKCKSNSSYSGSPHILARKAYLEDELSDLIDSSNEGETKSISRPLKWIGRTRIAGGNKISAIPTYSSAPVAKTFPNTDASPGSMVHGDADASVGDNGVSKLKLEGMLSVEGVPEDEDEPSNVNKSESSMSVNLPSGSSVSATHLQTEYDSINRVVHENHYSNNGEDSHMIESSSCKPTMSDDTCFTEGSKNQQMEEIVDKNILYMVHNVTPAPCTLDGAPLSCEENLSSPEKNHLSESSNEGPRMSEHPLKESPASCTVDGIPLNREDNLFSPENQPLSKSANDSPRMSERSLNPSPQEVSENGLQEDLSNHEIGANEVLGVFHRGSVHSSSCTEDTAEEEMSKQSLENMPQAGDGEDDFEVYPVVSQSNSQITIMPPAAEQPTELRFPVLETNDRETDAESTDDNQNRTVSSPNSENLQISGMAYILQPLDPVDSTTNDQIEEQFPDLSLSGTEHSSDGTDHNVILSGGNNMASLGGEIAVEVEKQAPSGILEGVCSEDIQAPVVLDSISQSDVETPDNGDENLHEFPSLAVRVETDVVPALETDLVKESPSVRPEISAFNEMQTSNTADDMLLLNSTSVGTSSEQIENLHELESLVGQKLEGVSSSTYLGARSTVDGEVIDGILSTDVDFGKTQSNQYPVDTKVPLAIMCSESGTEEKGNILKVASQSMDYDHTESRILVNSSNSYPESESSLHTDITASSTPEQSGSHMNVIRAEKNKLEDDTMESLAMRMYCYMEDQNVNLPLHQPDEKETEVFKMRGESNLDLNVADPSVLEQSESSSKWVDSDKGVLTSYTQDTSPVSTHRDEEGQKIRLPLHQLDEEINQVSTVKGDSNVVLEPQLTDRQNVDRLLSQDGISGIASISFSRNLPGQQSASELFPREKLKIDDGCQHNEPLGSVSPTLGLLPEAVNSDEVEMPPLPPLPPVQWRMGKTQPSSLAYEKTVLPNNNNLFPSISLGSNSNFLTLGELQPLNNLAAVTEFDSPNQNLLLPANNSKCSSTSETLQNLLLPAKLDEMPQHDDDTCTSLSASSSGTNGDAAADACDVELVAGSSSLDQYDNAEAISQTKLSHQGSASSENNVGTHDASGLLTKIEDEWPQNMMLSLEGVAWPTQEEGKPYGIRPMKLPRQRNPLIDAVIALDKSKLRKVTEQPRTHIQKADELDSVLENLQLRKVSEQPRTQIQKVNDRDSILENMQLRKVAEHPRPQIQEADQRDSALENLQLRKVPKQTRPQMQEADERDSLLEQIRAKSFNLKPPVVSKPAVQGPTTNLKLAAILEKAKTIRQAFAGSDEDDDDDDDSWSDS